MAEKRKQHYVPKMYLKRFLFDKEKEQFYLFNLKTNKDVGLVPYKDHCHGNYFYGSDKIWENKLEDKEKYWDTVIREVLDGVYDHVDGLKEFAIFQLGRTDAYNEKLTQSTSRVYEEYLKTGLNGKNIKCDESIVKKVANQKAKEITSPAKNLDLAEKLVAEISDLSFVKVHYATKNKLISSDNPVLAINPYFPPNVGFGVIGLIIIFPLDPNNLAVFYDDKIYPKLKGKKSIDITNEYEVVKVNALTFANAKNLVYSSAPFNKELLCKRNVKLRNDNLNRDDVDTFGPEDNKLIVTHQPTIYSNFSFSFSKIAPFYYVIKQDYRDPVMRKYDEGWEQKIAFKCQKSYVELISKVINGFDENQYRLGYLRFYKAMLKYWGINND